MMLLVKRLARLVPLAVAAIAMVFAMTGCTSSYPSVEQAKSQSETTPLLTSPSIMTDGVLTVGVNTDNAPYCWVTDSSTGALAGYDVDIATRIAESLGLEVRFVNVGDNANAAAEGLCDIVMGVTSDELDDSSVFTGSYGESATSVFAQGNSGSVITLSQLLAGSIGVQTNSMSALVFEGISSSTSTTGYDSLNEAFSALETGQIQYVICDSFLGGYLAVGYDDINFVGALEQPVSRGIAVSSTNSEVANAVQAAVDEISSNGIKAAIWNEYVGDLPTITQSNLIVTSDSTATDSAATDSTATAESANATDTTAATGDQTTTAVDATQQTTAAAA
jgi:ABC-type amino acid transport substrate-binding protein